MDIFKSYRKFYYEKMEISFSNIDWQLMILRERGRRLSRLLWTFAISCRNSLAEVQKLLSVFTRTHLETQQAIESQSACNSANSRWLTPPMQTPSSFSSYFSVAAALHKFHAKFLSPIAMLIQSFVRWMENEEAPDIYISLLAPHLYMNM